MTKKEEDNVRRRSTIQFLEYARSLGAYNRYGKADIDKNIAWLKKQGEQKKQVHFPKFTFNDLIALQCCMETVKKVQEDKELYEQLNLIHSKIYNDYWLGKQGELSPILSNFSNTEENEQKSNENKDEMIKTDILNDLKIIKLYEPPVISNSSNTETINKNIDLTKILKDCPKGTKFYSSLWGEVYFERILEKEIYAIEINTVNSYRRLTKEGYYITSDDAECIIFPSKDQKDWNKFTAPWCKKEKFDPKTLQPFDKVLVRDAYSQDWTCGFFSHIVVFDDACKYNVGEILYAMCIPYNDDTKHLVGTTEEAPEYYKHWED